MSRFFNTAGPQMPEYHYTLDPLRRVKVEGLVDLITRQRYFVLHAPRQTGKTSALLALRDKINAEGKLRALYVNIEAAKAVPQEDVQDALCTALARAVRNTFPEADSTALLEKARSVGGNTPFSSIINLLSQADTAHPLVLFIDEADTLQGRAMITFLSQLRAGYTDRPRNFPQSVILCGLRDIRDYRITDENGVLLTSGSAFNILAQSLTLGNFSREEVHELYAQHTAETGQRFTAEATDLAFDLTWGQPWMVNKLAELACFQMPPGKDRSVTITPELINAAREEMIQQRTVHLDNLAAHLTQDRVRRIVAPMLEGRAGDFGPAKAEDIRYCVDLGLARRDETKTLVISNPIYREIIPRELTYATQELLEQQTAWYRHPDGRMDLPKLLAAFQKFYREHGDSDRRFPQYSEAGAQLLLQAWLQRIINGGGQIEREYGLGMGRVDLLVRWPYPHPVQEMVVELKVIRAKNGPESVLEEGLRQIENYMQRVNATEGHLMIFDQRPGAEARIYQKPATTPGGREITVWGA